EWCMGHNLMVEAGQTNAIVTPFWDTYAGEWFFSFNSIYSPQLGNNRYYSVYMSPLLIENPHAVARHLLVMHDGNNLFTPTLKGNHRCPDGSCAPFGSWDLDATLDDQITSGTIYSDIVVLGLFNTDDRENEYTYSYDFSEEAGGKGDLYLSFISDTVLPNLDTLLGEGVVDAPPEDIVLMGSSLGGLISCYAGLAKNTSAEGGLQYGGVGCMSSSFWWNDEDMYNTIIPSNAYNPSVRVWVDSGSDGDGAFQTKKVETALIAEGYSLSDGSIGYYLDKGGIHNEDSWGKRVWRPLQFFFS
ncbi:putative esterase, partial [Kipferlia bialata]